MMAFRYLALTLGVVALIGVGAYAPMIFGSAPSGSGTTSSICTTTGTATTTQTSTASSTLGSFSYSPAAPVKVLSVAASTYQGGNGTMVTFSVTYENVGSSSIYTLSGCGSSLVATLPTDTSIIKRVTGGPVCLCAEAIMPLIPGANRTSTTPGCWTVYKVLLVHPGTVQVALTLYWGPDQTGQQQDATNITATFSFS